MGFSPKAFLRTTTALSILLTFAVAPLASASCVEGNGTLTLYSDAGDGTKANPYEIWSAEQLYSISRSQKGLTYHYEQCADINLGAFYSDERPYFTLGGKSDTKDLEPFTGSYNGNGNTIVGFTYDVNGPYYDSSDRMTNDNIGLFALMTRGAKVHNLNISGAHIVTDGELAGTVVAELKGGEVYDINVSTIVHADPKLGLTASQFSSAGGRLGGVVGEMSAGATLENVYAFVDVQGRRIAGGAVATTKSWGGRPTVRNVLVKGSVTGSMNSVLIGGVFGSISYTDVEHVESNATVRGSVSVGGLAGSAKYSTISYALATGDVGYSHSESDHVGYSGGLVGIASNVTVNWSAATGDVKGRINVGGFIGVLYLGSTIENCYATGNVMAMRSQAGGFIGDAPAFSSYNRTTPTVINSYAAGDVMAPEGLVGAFYGEGQERYVTQPVADGSFAVGEAIGGASFGNKGISGSQIWFNSDVMDANGDIAGGAASLSAGHFDNPNRSLGVEWMHGYVDGPTWYFQQGKLPTIPQAGALF